ncbi:MAG: hypothetical protein Q9168_002740, partial [Polycauliona sp. 1 TL-2023]
MWLSPEVFALSIILLFGVEAQDDIATTVVSSTSQNSVAGIETAPFPTATGPQCLQPRGPSDPPASDISQALSADDSVSSACNIENQTTETIGQLLVISYAWQAYFFNISHNVHVVSRPIATPNQCPDAFNSILEKCVAGAGNFWGGYTQVGIANYSITNHVYPEDALVQPDSSDPTTTDGAPFATRTGFESIDRLSGTPVNQATRDVPNSNSHTTTYVDGPSNTDDSNSDPQTTSAGFEDDDNFDTQGLTDRTTSDAAESRNPKNAVTSSLAQANSAPLPPGATVMSKTISGVVVTETFVPTRISQYASLLTTTSVTSVDAQNSAFTYLVGPGGVAWAPLSPLNAGPQIQPTNAPIQSATRTSRHSLIMATTSTIARAGSTPSQGSPTRTIADPATTGGVLPAITTAVDAQAATLTSVEPAITGNTAISTGDDVVVNGDLVPSAKGDPEDDDEDDDDEPTSTQPQETQPTTTQISERSTGSCTASTVVQECKVLCSGENSSQSCSTTCMSSTVTCSGRGTTVTSIQTGACERPSAYQTTLAPVTEPSKGLGRGSVVLPGGGGRTDGVSRTSSASTQSSTVRANGGSGSQDPSAPRATTPASTIKPTQVPNPFPFTSTNIQNGEVVACATSSIDTAKSSTACQGSSTVVSTVASIAEAAVPTANCDFWDEGLYWNLSFSEVYNINGWAGDSGSSLKTQEKGCGALTGWEWHVDNERYQHAYFNLPFTIKEGCAERAIKSAGGPGGLSCKGHGLKKRSDERKAQRPSIQPPQRMRSKRYGKRSEHRFTHEFLGEKSVQAASQNISSRSLVPRAHTDAWNKYAPKGIQYYNEWKNRPVDQDDKADLCNFDQTYDFSQDPLAVTGPYDPIKAYINGAKGQTYTNFRWHWPKGPTNAATAIFWNNISPVDNAIIAFSNDRGGDEEEGEDPSPDNWSDMLWWLWLRATTAESSDKAALSQIFRYNVDNEASKDILQEVLGDKQDEVVTLEADDAQSSDNGFWALLGCPNGTGMIHIVGDHKKALGGKGIK